MNSPDSRRSPRYADFLPITVSVGSRADSKRLSGPFSARIVDISNHGACLLLTQVMMHSFHIFHSTREDDDNCLHLHIRLQNHGTSEIAARPVWLNTVQLEDIKVFKMGVEFISVLDNELLLTINKMIKMI